MTNTVQIFATGKKDEIGHEYGSVIVFDGNERPIATGWLTFSIINEKNRRGRPPEVNEKWKKFLICVWNIYADASIKDSAAELEKKLGFKDNNGRSVKRIKKDMNKSIKRGSLVLAGTGETTKGESARIAFIFDPNPTLKQSTQAYILEGVGWHWDSVENVATYNNWQLKMTNPVDAAFDGLNRALNDAQAHNLAAKKSDNNSG